MSTVGERFKQVRKEIGLSQNDLGKILGVKRDVINNVENERLKNPSQKEPLFKLFCQEFDISYEWLMNDIGKPFLKFPKTIIDELAKVYKLDDEMKEIIARFVNLTPEEQAGVKKLFFPVLNEKKDKE
ncbi:MULTISPECIES: helix-turn-helix domain-containing protein [Erysipelotrichaceae]|uniref:helix-turn-helix domain-containing protein n=1 Tax=Erysipelotrichaceae TaxID=128827 RepID=UPI000E4D985B|nr:helix-turn-helix domain-containing protein [Absiella sp. AM27-20]RHT97346.1 helix-turn-helix domain-containing protein [Absiella sp. AM27-20]